LANVAKHADDALDVWTARLSDSRSDEQRISDIVEGLVAADQLYARMIRELQKAQRPVVRVGRLVADRPGAVALGSPDEPGR